MRYKNDLATEAKKSFIIQFVDEFRDFVGDDDSEVFMVCPSVHFELGSDQNHGPWRESSAEWIWEGDGHADIDCCLLYKGYGRSGRSFQDGTTTLVGL